MMAQVELRSACSGSMSALSSVLTSLQGHELVHTFRLELSSFSEIRWV